VMARIAVEELHVERHVRPGPHANGVGSRKPSAC
jgi:hypothetical protein